MIRIYNRINKNSRLNINDNLPDLLNVYYEKNTKKY